MRVAAIQFAPQFKNVAANASKMEDLILEAATEGADLIVFPELATTGYSFMGTEEADPFSEVLHAKEASTDLVLSKMKMLAERLGVVLVWGCVEKDPESKKLYNSQVYVEFNTPVNQEKSVGFVESYRKINHFSNDYLWASRGDKNPPIIRSSRLHKKVGLLICRDIRDKRDAEWDNFYSAGEADLVCFSANWGKGGFPAHNWVEFAEQNKVWLVVSNRYGVEQNNDFGLGGTCVISPEGIVHCEGLKWNEDCIIYKDIP